MQQVVRDLNDSVLPLPAAMSSLEDRRVAADAVQAEKAEALSAELQQAKMSWKSNFMEIASVIEENRKVIMETIKEQHVKVYTDLLPRINDLSERLHLLEDWDEDPENSDSDDSFISDLIDKNYLMARNTEPRMKRYVFRKPGAPCSITRGQLNKVEAAKAGSHYGNVRRSFKECPSAARSAR